MGKRTISLVNGRCEMSDESGYHCPKGWQVALTKNVRQPKRLCAACAAKMLKVVNPSSFGRETPIIQHKRASE
jgi:hypothetical protein